MIRIALTLILLFAVSASVYSRGAYEYKHTKQSIRALGMGNAYHTVSDDRYSIFYNPAGLARVDEGRFDFVPLSVGFSNTFMDAYYDLRKRTDGWSDTDAFFDNTSQISDFMRGYIGDDLYGNIGIDMVYYRPDFSVGVYSSAKTYSKMSNSVYPEISTDSLADVIVGIGLAHAFLDDHLQVGGSLKGMGRYQFSDNLTATDIASEDFGDNVKDNVNSGYGLTADVGVIYNFALDGLNPRVGMSVNDFKIIKLKKVDNPNTLVNVSAAITPRFSTLDSKVELVMDYTDIFFANKEDKDIAKRINMGAELSILDDLFAVRTGLHQGYLSFGAGLHFAFMDIQYAHYYEEVGAYAGQKADRRDVLQMALSF